MKREEDNSWDFLFECNENQWQLISDIDGTKKEALSDCTFDLEADGFQRHNADMVWEDEDYTFDLEAADFPKRYAEKIMKNANTRKGVLFYDLCSDLSGYYLTYGEFLNGIIDDMDDMPKTKLLSSKKYEREENIILLYCLKRLALEQPKVFKSLYNLASTSTEDIVKELEIRFCTSPALRCSLPAVLCSCLAKEQSILLSKEGKKAIDENLTSLEEASLLGNYHYAGSLAKLNSLDALWALGGPIGILAGMAYHVGKELFSNKGKSEKEDDEEEAQEDNTFALACALIMLRRGVCGIVWNEKQAYNNVCKWMDDSSFSLSDEWHRQEEKAFVEALFLKILKKKDKEKYRLVMNAYVYKEEHHTRVDNQIDAKIELLLPHAVYLVEKLWDKLIADHSKEYVYTLSQLSARMSGKSCLATEFHPDFVDNENRVHFLVDQASRGAVMLCLELMGHDSTDVCKERATLKKEYDRIFVSNETQREEMLAYVKPYSNGKVYSFYAKFGGKVTPASTHENEIKELKEELEKKEEELRRTKEELKTQRDESLKMNRFFENAAHSFRHTRMPDIERMITMATNDIETNPEEMSDAIRKLREARVKLTRFTENFARKDDICNVSLLSITKEVFDNIRPDIKVEYVNETNEDGGVLLSNTLFKEWVLENIKCNIERHAFPKAYEQVNPVVRIRLKAIGGFYVLIIENNGKVFEGNSDRVFRESVKYGETGHTGCGLYLAKCYLDDYHKGSSEIMFVPNPDEDFTVAVEIKLRKE